MQRVQQVNKCQLEQQQEARQPAREDTHLLWQTLNILRSFWIHFYNIVSLLQSTASLVLTGQHISFPSEDPTSQSSQLLLAIGWKVLWSLQVITWTFSLHNPFVLHLHQRPRQKGSLQQTFWKWPIGVLPCSSHTPNAAVLDQCKMQGYCRAPHGGGHREVDWQWFAPHVFVLLQEKMPCFLCVYRWCI